MSSGQIPAGRQVTASRQGTNLTSPPPAHSGALADLVTWVEPMLPQLTEDVFDAACERIDLYRDGDVVPREDLRRSVERNLRGLIGALADPTIQYDLKAPSDTGRRRALQGAPLPEVLRVYRIGYGMLWNALVEHARDHPQPGTLDAMVDAASILWQITDEHALALTEAYRSATAEAIVTQQRRRSALVDALFTGELVSGSGPWEAGKLLGLPLDGKLVVVAAENTGLAEESLQGVERRLAELGIVSAWQLTSTSQSGVVAVRDEQIDALMDVLQDTARARTGLSPLYHTLADTPRALHLARAALAGLPAGKPAVRMFSTSPLAALVAHDPDGGRRLAEEVFGAVLDLQPDDRTALLETLEAFLDNAGSSDRAARVLHCHPNTVRYRLRRVRELTGRSLTDPIALAELTTAVEAVRQRPRT